MNPTEKAQNAAYIVNAKFDSQIEAIEREKVGVIKWQTQFNNNPKLISLLEETRARALEYSISLEFSIGYGFNQLNGILVHIYPNYKWQAERIVSLWRTVFGQSPDPNDYAEIGRRSWSFKEAGLELTLSAFFRGENCKFEQIGTETKPLYKLVCESENA